MYAPDFMVIHPVDVEIFQSGPKWWSNQPALNRVTVPRAFSRLKTIDLAHTHSSAAHLLLP